MIDMQINFTALSVCVIAFAMFVLFFVWLGVNIGAVIEILFDVISVGNVLLLRGAP
jgi:hypothetical protein